MRAVVCLELILQITSYHVLFYIYWCLMKSKTDKEVLLRERNSVCGYVLLPLVPTVRSFLVWNLQVTHVCSLWGWWAVAASITATRYQPAKLLEGFLHHCYMEEGKTKATAIKPWPSQCLLPPHYKSATLQWQVAARWFSGSTSRCTTGLSSLDGQMLCPLFFSLKLSFCVHFEFGTWHLLFESWATCWFDSNTWVWDLSGRRFCTTHPWHCWSMGMRLSMKLSRGHCCSRRPLPSWR